jgi:uncharacterized protein YjdB
VEEVVMRADCVDECLLMPITVGGNTALKLLVVLKEGKELDEAAIRAVIAENLEPYKQPKKIQVIDEIIKTFNGKTAVCAVTVTAEPTEVFLPENLTLCLKEKTTVAATAAGPDGETVPTTFKYSASQGTGKITVNPKTGKVVGKALGTARIRVITQNGVSTHLEDGLPVETVCEVNVVEAPGRIELASGEITIELG